jgi:hypothetical protein
MSLEVSYNDAIGSKIKGELVSEPEKYLLQAETAKAVEKLFTLIDSNGKYMRYAVLAGVIKESLKLPKELKSTNLELLKLVVRRFGLSQELIQANLLLESEREYSRVIVRLKL